jgi:undecaprenyl-diphosphatase
MPDNWDLRWLLALNAVLSAHPLLARVAGSLGNNALVRGLPIFYFLFKYWFQAAASRQRSRILIGLLAACLATGVSVLLQHHLSFHIRPFLDPSLHLFVSGETPESLARWNRINSFPSDTSTLFFALATVVFLERRIAGGFAFLWALLFVGVVRCAHGWHYPSDVAAGFVLGAGSVLLLTRIGWLQAVFERALRRLETRMYIVHTLVFAFLADAYNLFAGLESTTREISGAIQYLLGR